MSRPSGKIFVAALVAGALAGCAPGDGPGFLASRTADPGPDEFGIVPNQPLEVPPDLAALPPPTRGGANRADQTPAANAVVALGGSPGAAAAPGIPAADGALVRQAGRSGVDPNVRATLAAEDAETRSRGGTRLLERLFRRGNSETRVYGNQLLLPYDELERLRAAGIDTPSAPPDPDR